MENYEFLRLVSKGTYGVLQTMRDAEEGKTVAVKMIECMDEGMANKALREAMLLLDLHHPSICRYREMFVAWNKEEAAVSVCMVMDYAQVGDVAFIIREKRRRKEKIREMVIKNFLGQMVDVLIYIHSKDIIHGNLKPSNILLMKDLSFAISDFTIPTFVTDEVKFKIRMRDHEKTWMAPEVLNGEVNTKNDIWSLGCIVLEMLMCSKTSEKEFQQLVAATRIDFSQLPPIMEELNTIQKYTKNLCSLVQMMMEPNYLKRICAADMMELLYVKEALVICNSPLSGRKKSPVGVMKIPYDQDIDVLLEYMQSEIEAEEAQKSALKYMVYLLHEPEMYMASAQIIPVLITLLNAHPKCLEIQAQVCQIFLKLAIKATELSVDDSILFSETVINAVLSVMESQRKSVELQMLICKLLMVQSGSESAGKLIGQAKGIQSILKTLGMYIDHSHICIPCCGAIWALVTNKMNARTAHVEGALETIWQVLEIHLQNGDVVEMACLALWSLSLEEMLSDAQFEDITLLLIGAFELHKRKENNVRNICLCLSSLIRLSELVAFRILVPDKQFDGLKMIMKSYYYHQNDSEAVQTICMVFQDMTQYEDVLPCLLSENVDKLLSEIQIKFASNEDIITIVNPTLLKFQKFDRKSENEGGNSSA
ncbi:serine/threonine kinase-like domain-containing protein STKLD1 [Rhinoraja longicauda]